MFSETTPWPGRAAALIEKLADSEAAITREFVNMKVAAPSMAGSGIPQMPEWTGALVLAHAGKWVATLPADWNVSTIH